MRLLCLASALALGALAAGPAAAQPSLRQVTSQLDGTRDALRGEGYSRVRAYTTASMDEGDERTFTFTLQRGREYVVSGACDGDCTDLDFALTDDNGNEVDSDLALDNRPVVGVTPVRNGSFSLRVTMAACSVEPCYYGFGIFRK